MMSFAGMDCGICALKKKKVLFRSRWDLSIRELLLWLLLSSDFFDFHHKMPACFGFFPKEIIDTRTKGERDGNELFHTTLTARSLAPHSPARLQRSSQVPLKI